MVLPELVSPASQAQSQRGSGLSVGPSYWVLLSVTAVRIFEKSNDLVSAEARGGHPARGQACCATGRSADRKEGS